MNTPAETTQSDSPQVVVVTQEKKRRLAVPLVAAAAGAALLGGTTFALWSASDTVTGGSIVAGDLNITGSDAAAFYDVSSDREDATTALPNTGSAVLGHTIADTWRIVPGDKVAAAFDADVTLTGDNLVAKLSLGGFGSGALTNDGMTYTYAVYQAGTEVVAETALPSGNAPALLYLAAPETGQGGDADADPSGPPVVHAMAASTETVTVVVFGTFDAATADRDYVTTTDALGDLTLQLEQVRDAGAVFS